MKIAMEEFEPNSISPQTGTCERLHPGIKPKNKKPHQEDVRGSGKGKSVSLVRQRLRKSKIEVLCFRSAVPKLTKIRIAIEKPEPPSREKRRFHFIYTVKAK
jgi:hypothetical protein